MAVQGKQPRLDVKKDPKGMVTVPGATVLEVTSAKQLWAAIESGQKNRHVAATQVPSVVQIPSVTSAAFVWQSHNVNRWPIT